MTSVESVEMYSSVHRNMPVKMTPLRMCCRFNCRRKCRNWLNLMFSFSTRHAVHQSIQLLAGGQIHTVYWFIIPCIILKHWFLFSHIHLPLSRLYPSPTMHEQTAKASCWIWAGGKMGMWWLRLGLYDLSAKNMLFTQDHCQEILD